MLWGGVFCTVGFEISIFTTLKAPLARTTGLADQENTDLRQCEIFPNPNGEGGRGTKQNITHKITRTANCDSQETSWLFCIEEREASLDPGNGVSHVGHDGLGLGH